MRLDPRTKAFLVISTSLTVMSPGGQVFVPGAVMLALVLAASVGAWRRILIVLLVVGAFAALLAVLPEPPSGVGVAVALLASFGIRLAAVVAVAAHLVATTTTAEWSAALSAARVPRVVRVPTTVMLRFLPVVEGEARGVVDAMRLRGIGGWRGLLRRPLATVEWFTVPLIASSLRIGDDLTAAALLRGLGREGRPTCMHPPRFGAVDLLAVVLLAACAWLSWMLTR